MGLSETVLAAIIGALATIGTAIFQLIRNRAPSEGRPKKNRMRSLVATIALMIGCIVGGYAWSALRAMSAREELAATMEEQFNKRFGEQIAHAGQAASADASAAGSAGTSNAIAARNGEAGSSEALAHLPPCHVGAQPDEVGPVLCTERVAQSIALCAAIPSGAHTTNVRVQARVPKSESPWLERDAGAPTLGSLHIAAASVEYPVSPISRSVCLDVSNWSVEDTLAVRLTVDYAFGPAQGSELTASAPTGTTL
jgi:hypothetical protein